MSHLKKKKEGESLKTSPWDHQWWLAGKIRPGRVQPGGGEQRNCRTLLYFWAAVSVPCFLWPQRAEGSSRGRLARPPLRRRGHRAQE